MTGRVLFWVGAIVGVLALAGLGVYFAASGLDKADKVASVIGAFVAVVSLAMSAYGLIRDRLDTGGSPASGMSASGERSIAVGGDNTGIASTGDDTRNRQSR